MSDVEKARQGLAGAISNGEDTHGPFIELLYVNVPLDGKFRLLKFGDLLEKNSESADNVKKLMQGLNILEKYGRHLLKPLENRSNMWRHIKYSNNIFRERVDTIQGGRDIMSLMGYTQSKPDGVAFPDGAEPDHGHVLNLVIDIYQGRKELEMFLENQHPHPEIIKEHLSQRFRELLDDEMANPGPVIKPGTKHPQVPVPSVRPIQQQGTQAVIHQPPQSMDPRSEITARHMGPGSQSMQPNLLDAPVQGYQAPHNTLARPVLQQNPHSTGQPGSVGLLKQQQQQQYQQQLQQQHQQQQQQNSSQPEPALFQRQQLPGQSEIGLERQHVIGQLGQQQAFQNQLEPSLQHQQGLTDLPPPASMTQFVPKSSGNVADQGARPKTSPQEMKLDVNSAATLQNDDNGVDTKTPSIACDICNNHADVLCQLCSNKTLCRGCNEKWHSHPRRLNHKPENLRRDSAFSAAPNPPQANNENTKNEGEMGAGYSQQKSQMSAGRQGDAYYPNNSSPYDPSNRPANQQQVPQFTQNSSSQYNTMPYSPSHVSTSSPTMVNVELPSVMNTSYVYPQPIPGTIHYPGSMMPGQHLAYPVPSYAPHMSFMTAPPSQIYMPHQPGHISMQGGYMGIPATSGGVFDRSGMHVSASDSNLPKSSSAGQVQPRPEFVGHLRQSISSPKVSESGDQSSTWSSSGSPASVSTLLPGIKKISNLEQRLSRLDVHLMTLNEDMQDWEKELNDIMIRNPDFFHDERYQSLARKKRRHLQETSELKKYKVELEQEIAAKSSQEKKKERGDYESKAEELEYLKKRFKELGLKDQGSQNPGYPVYDAFVTPQGPPSTTGSMPYVIVTGSADIARKTVFQPLTNNQSTYQPPTVKPSPAVTTNQRASATPPDLRLDSLGGDNMEEIKKMLVLDQNPFAPKQNIPFGVVTPLVNKSGSGEHVMYPPTIDKTLPTIAPANQNLGNLNMNIQVEQLQNAQNKRIAAESTDERKWECEHCTYQNEFSSKACEMCFKTSDIRKTIEASTIPERAVPVESAQDYDETAYTTPGEPCEHCTYENPVGSKVCLICDKSQTRYQNVKEPNWASGVQENTDRQRNPAENVIEQESSPTTVAGSGSTADAASGAENEATAGVGKLIDEEQDRVFLEKKEAQKKYEQMRRSGLEEQFEMIQIEESSHVSAGLGVSPKIASGASKPGAKVESENRGQKGRADSFGKLPDSGLKEKLPSPKLTVPNKDLDRVRSNSDQDPRSTDSSTGSYTSAPTSFDTQEEGVKVVSRSDESEVKVKQAPPAGAGVAVPGSVGKPELSFAEAIEKINIRRDQEQMSLDGHELLNLIKECEHGGYQVAEVEIAIRLSIENNMRPLDWLNDVWASMLTLVVNSVTEEGKKADQNNIGDLSPEEAKQALIDSDADIEKATRQCLEQRKAKFAAINRCGEFAREDILTALLQNKGDVDEVVDQLNNSVLQTFTHRLWNPEEGGGSDVIIMAAARTMGTESVPNSVIGHYEFQRLVKDTDIDRERRVRMVFVEAKLRSWGRADTVINILDNDITNSADPLECTLEDVIEAVRNCGDRRSSLVYLKQECGVCFAYYPMSKIRKLGTCACNLCESCLRQNFEVVIKERHIRNWSCPLCESPGLEDETSASEYFEFLSLLLNNLVSKEIIELFETKLRDWHLQKDPNFRWCAHCVTGFLWDQNDRLDMTCPSCTKKTCFKCKKMWEETHKGITCEQFTQWKIDNDPEKQAKGVQLYLEENGIDCPSCKMRYSLAKGGCMHFKCPQCGYEFCSGCSQAFVKQECKLLKACKDKGLHCHHPRDCFYYLRDNDPDELQTLLKKNRVQFNTEAPQTQDDLEHCPVMEQKEYDAQKKDEPCGRDTTAGMAGLCEVHYKEYLVSLINKSTIDPVDIMTVQQMMALIHRNEKEPPKLRQNETELAYGKRLAQFIKERWRLHR